jgi:hypothetical protein
LPNDRDRLVPLAHRGGVMTAFPQAQVSVWRNMGHHPQSERPSELARFIEGACDRGRTSVRDAASGPNPLLTRVSGAAITPQSLRDDAAGDFPAVA